MVTRTVQAPSRIVRVDGWTWLDVARWDRADVHQLCDQLTVIPRRDPRDPRPPKPVHCYRLEDNLLGVPRHHPVARLFSAEGAEDATSPGSPIEVEFTGELRDDQPEAHAKFRQGFESALTYGGILRAPGAWGKTVLGARLVADRKCTTLVLVHRTFLVDQWRETFETFLPGVRVGIVQRDRCEFEGYDVAIAMVESLASARPYPEAFYRWPGMVISDEVHVFGAQTWAPLAPMFAARYRVGMSATPRRKDGCAKIFNWHMGEVEYTTDVARMQGKVRRIFTGWPTDKLAALAELNAVPDFVVMRKMTTNGYRNTAIVDELDKVVASGRKVFVFSGRKNHLRLLHDLFKFRNPGVSMGFYLGGMGVEVMKNLANVQVVFTTYQMSGQGLNVPNRDTALLTTPVGDIEQIWYRITRWMEGKKTPIAVEFLDLGVKLCDRTWQSRARFYRKIGALPK